MNVTIETSEDPAEIVELCRQVHEEHRQRHPARFKPLDREGALEVLDHLLSHNGGRLFVARLEGDCVGYAVVRDVIWQETPLAYGSRSLMVDQMAVSIAHRRQGIGRLLMERIRAEAARREAQCVEMLVHSNNEGARRFYEAQGFVRVLDIMESSQ